VDRSCPGYKQAASPREENLAAANIELSPEDLREIDSAASNISLQGAHYPENLQKMVGR
jgi:hypothetical protein